MSGGSANLSGSMKTFTQYSEFGNAQFKTSMDAPSVSVSFSVRVCLHSGFQSTAQCCVSREYRTPHPSGLLSKRRSVSLRTPTRYAAVLSPAWHCWPCHARVLTRARPLQQSLGDTTEETSQETVAALKRLRRNMPITGSRMDWSAGAHRALPRGHK